MRPRVASFLCASTILLAACVCENEVIAATPSPDGRLQAIVYARGCGATVGANTHVSILPRGRSLGDETANVLLIDAGHDPAVSLDVTARWAEARELVVSYDPRVRVFRKHDVVDGIRIRFVDRAGHVAPAP